jgi:hypothetical protein
MGLAQAMESLKGTFPQKRLPTNPETPPQRSATTPTNRVTLKINPVLETTNSQPATEAADMEEEDVEALVSLTEEGTSSKESDGNVGLGLGGQNGSGGEKDGVDGGGTAKDEIGGSTLNQNITNTDDPLANDKLGHQAEGSVSKITETDKTGDDNLIKTLGENPNLPANRSGLRVSINEGSVEWGLSGDEEDAGSEYFDSLEMSNSFRL